MEIKIWSYNLYKKEISNQVNEIKENEADILFLQESSLKILSKIENYEGILINSHCYYTCLAIKKELNPILIKSIKYRGNIIVHINIKGHEVVLVNVHLSAGENNKKIRKIEINKIIKILEENKLNEYPIILAGDTNMRDDENKIIEKIELIDVYMEEENELNYKTYPNNNCINKKIEIKNEIERRYDRIYIRNCEYKNLKIKPNKNSDHLIVETLIKLKNKKENICNRCKNKNIDIDIFETFNNIKHKIKCDKCDEKIEIINYYNCFECYKNQNEENEEIKLCDICEMRKEEDEIKKKENEKRISEYKKKYKKEDMNLHTENGKYIILDIETNGGGFNLAILQIYYEIYDEKMKLLIKKNIFINDGTNYNDYYLKLNKEIIENIGIDPKKAYKIIIKDINSCEIIIGHNVESFDIAKLKIKINEYTHKKLKTYIKYYDLKDTKKILNLKDKLGRLKMPKLKEIHEYLYPEKKIDDNQLHDAEYDVKITMECYIKIQELFNLFN